MQHIVIEVEHEQDRELIINLIKRLGLKWSVGKKEAQDHARKMHHHLEVIDAGVAMEDERLQELLSWHEKDRNDRNLPPRS